MNTSQLIEAFQCGDEVRIEEAICDYVFLSEAEKASALDQLSLLMESSDADLRWWVVRALAEVSDPRADVLRLQALQDEDWRVCQCAAIALRLHPDPQAIALLVDLLDHREENHGQGELTSRLAADALVAIGGEAVPALLSIFRSGSQRARLHAGRALAQIGDSRAIPDLINVFDENSALLEYWANRGLEKMGVGMAFFIPE